VYSFVASIRSVPTSSISVASNEWVVIELDGGQHEDQRARDEARTQWLAEHGFRLLRFSDREALMETEAVLAEIQNRL
jgi:very-short-patch-repair endonuclease